jgi:hypothetical protein
MTDASEDKMSHIKLTPAEIQSNHSRQKWAEGLIEQLPENHDGRNSWLLNYGTGETAQKLREAHHLWFDPDFNAVSPGHIHVAGTTVGKHIDECARCGRDLRHPIHSRGH